MKIKPIGKVFIFAVIGLLAFFGIRRYQLSHTSPVVITTMAKTDSVAMKSDSIVQDTNYLAKPKDTPLYPSAKGTSSDLIKAHQTEKKVHHPKKDDGTGRKNLDLQNY